MAPAVGEGLLGGDGLLGLGPVGKVLQDILGDNLLGGLIEKIKTCVVPFLEKTLDDKSQLTSLTDILDSLSETNPSLTQL